MSFLWTPFDYTALNIPGQTADTQMRSHWLGTDHFGRDLMFSMIMVGARTSIAVALVAVGIGMALGVPLGLAAAARKGSWLDEVIMRGNDLVFAFPSLVIAILITAVFGAGADQRHHRHRHFQHPGLRPHHPRRRAVAVAARIHPGRPGQQARARRGYRWSTSCPM